MKIGSVAIFTFIAIIIAVAAFGGTVAQNASIETEESYHKAILDAKSDRDKALLRKKLGDFYAKREDYKKGAEEYLRALSLSHDFTEEEKVQMAVSLSWADRLDDAIALLKSVLAENPKNNAARIHCAQALSWSGRLAEAEEEADAILRESPENKDALLVKANVTRWRGDARASMALYEKILALGEDFDARLGLAYACLNAGDTKSALKHANLLKPQYAYQVKELKKFQDASRERRQRAAGGFTYYRDSDGNRVNRYSLNYGLKMGNGNSNFGYVQSEAVDHVRRTEAEEAFLKVDQKWGRFASDGGIGVVREGKEQAGNLVTGFVKTSMTVPSGVIGLSASREVLTDTAQLIENKIVKTGAALLASRDLASDISLLGSYRYASYSDSNRSQDFIFRAKYRVPTSVPRIVAGYNLRYLDFAHQTRDGYFDPENFFSQHLFVTLSAEAGALYVSMEPYFGYQAFTRYGEKNHQIFYGASGALGYTIAGNISTELSGEGGKNAAGAVSVYNYYLISARVAVTF